MTKTRTALKPSEDITNDPPILTVNECPPRDLSPRMIVVNDLFEEANGGKLRRYAPARERPVGIGSPGL
jgi:hypothetical protein